jgi:hypothetical protein
MNHPSEETLKRFAAGTSTREENRAVVAHLLKKCPACARTLRSLMGPDLGSLDDDSTDPLLPRPTRAASELLLGAFPKG